MGSWFFLICKIKNQINFAGGRPAASHFSCLAKKSNQKKSPPVYRRFAVPCVARLVRRLRNSRYALRQSSPKSPDQPARLGGAQGRRSKKSKTVISVGQQVAQLMLKSKP
jgi:hypothetical protein